MSLIRFAVLAFPALMMAQSTTSGQVSSVAPVTPAKSGMVSYIQGAVYLNDELLPDPLVGQYPYVKDKSALRTVEGRAEVFMNPGLSIHLDAHSSLGMLSSQFEDTRVELTQGAAVAATPEIDKNTAFTIKVGDASIAVVKPGRYHFYAEPARVKVFSGLARVQIDGQKIEVPGGKMLDLTGQSARLEKFDKDATDALDRWAARRGELMASANISSARNCNTLSFVSSSGRLNPCAGSWRWNPWFSVYTYIPYANRWCDPMWGYCYYNPIAVMMIYRQPYYLYSGGGYSGGNRQGPVTQPNPSANRPAAVTRTINSANRPVAPSQAGSDSRGMGVRSPGSMGGMSSGGSMGSSSGGSVPSGGGVSSGGGAVGGSSGASAGAGGGSRIGGAGISTGGGPRR